MILMCPFCGHQIPRPLMNGMSSCNNCCRVFDSSKINTLLSTAWLVRKKHVNDCQVLVDQYCVEEADAKFVIDNVADGCRSHEEFFKLLKDQEKNS
jgi:hypothetical protein